MCKCPNARLAVTNVRRVMELTQDGLDGEEDNDNNTDDGMVVVDLQRITISACLLGLEKELLRRSTNLSFRFKSNVHAEPKSSQCQHVGENLRCGMNPYESGK